MAGCFLNQAKERPVWDLVTLKKRNDAQYCEWLVKRLCATLAESGIIVSERIKEQVVEFVQQLPERREPPQI